MSFFSKVNSAAAPDQTISASSRKRKIHTFECTTEYIELAYHMNSSASRQLFVRTPYRKSGLDILICLCLVVVTLSAYGQLRWHDFIGFDDEIYVISNRNVRDGLTLEGLKWSLGFKNEKRTYWHPITWWSHMLDVQFFGLDPSGHLMTNLSLHALNSLLIFFLLRRWSASAWPAAIAASLFALHPIGVESVAWVASRKNLLSSFFWILTLLLYARYSERPGPGRYAAVVLVFILGLMAKPMLITLPFVLLLLDYWPLRRLEPNISKESQRALLLRLIVEKIPLMALSILSIVFSVSSLQGHNSLMPHNAVPIGIRIANALVSYVVYLGKLLWPLELSVFYPFPRSIPLWQPVAAMLLLLSVTLFVLRLHRSKPYLITGWLWYLGTLVPVLGLVQAGLWPATADRFVYIPFIGLYIMIAWGSVDILADWRYSRTFLVVFASLMVVLAARTWKQAGYWKNSLTLFGHALEIDRNNILAHNNIGKALIEQGRVAEAVEHYKVAVSINPNYISACKNLGAALGLQGKNDEAVSFLLEALRIDPHQADVHYNLGNLFSEQKRPTEAIRYYSEALRLNPKYFEAHNNLANLLADMGRIEDALRHFKAALLVNPRYAKTHNNIGTAFTRQNRLKEAVYHYRTAIDIRPDYAEAYNNLGVILKQQGQVDEAVIHYRRALQFNPEYGEAHFNLGLALASAGNLEMAALHFDEALRIKPDDAGVQHQRDKTRADLIRINADIDTVNAMIAANPERPALHLNMGDLCKKKGDLQGAMASYRQALIHNGAFVPAFEKLGALYARTGEFDQAIDVFKKIAGLEPESAEACYWLAGLLAVQVQIDEAIEWLKIAVDRGYDDWDRLNQDPKFRNIRGTPYYKTLMMQSSL